MVSRCTYADPNAGTPYLSDELGRRTQCVREGAAFAASHHDVRSHNARNELTGSTRRAGTAPGSGTLDADLGRGHEYDPIGNRDWYDEGQATRLHYCANELNQYETTAAGDADCPPNTAAESFTHDLDGNLTQDGRFTYAWDAENRLISATPVDPNDPNTPVAVTFAYDYMSRRVRKQILEWSGGQWVQSIAPGSDVRFLWYNWLMLLELDDSNAAVRKYAWGLDLAGQSGQVNSLESAGGIGGLLAVYDTAGTPSTSDDLKYIYFYDGNGNVGQVVDPNAANVSAAMVARYEYDAYGKVTAQAGSYASTNPFRFSTKYWDDETGLGNWGLRYYDPGTRRWLTRDPLEEQGGFGLYAFVHNRAPDRFDSYGLQSTQPASSQSKACCRYETTTSVGSANVSLPSTTRFSEKTMPCGSNASAPEQCCNCCTTHSSSFTFFGPSYVSEATQFVSARWGACCSCIIQQRRQVTSFWNNPLAYVTGTEHTAIFIKCSDGRKYFLDHAGPNNGCVMTHVRDQTRLDERVSDANVRKYSVAVRSRCISCDDLEKILDAGRSHDGEQYGLWQDCYWFANGVFAVVNRAIRGSEDECPTIP